MCGQLGYASTPPTMGFPCITLNSGWDIHVDVHDVPAGTGTPNPPNDSGFS